MCYQSLASGPEVIELHQRSPDINENLEELEAQAAELGNRGLEYRALGDILKARDSHQGSLVIEEKLGRLDRQAIQLGNLGICFQMLGDLPNAIELIQRSLAIDETLGNIEGQAVGLGNLGTLLPNAGGYSRSHRLSSARIQYRGKIGKPRRAGQAPRQPRHLLSSEIRRDRGHGPLDSRAHAVRNDGYPAKPSPCRAPSKCLEGALSRCGLAVRPTSRDESVIG